MKFKTGTLYVFVANVINLLISLFTGFMLPKILNIETYANIKLFQLYITYIGILHFGFADGMYLKLGGKDIKNLDINDILSEFKTFKAFQLIITIIAIIVSIILKQEMLIFCSLVILPINVGSYLRNLYQAIGKFDSYSRFTNINTILIFFINLFLLFIVKSDNYYVYIIGYIVAYFIYWVYIELETKKIIGNKKSIINFKYVLEDIKSGFFLMIGNFCNAIFTGIDRIFVQNLLGVTKFAFYSFAVSIENLMNIFITPISTVMYNYLCNNKETDTILKVKKIILIFSTIVISVIFPAKFIIDVWLTKYQESTGVLFLLISAQYISIMVRCMHVNLYKAEKKQNKYFIIMLTVVILSVILNATFFYIHKTMEMIALATLITNIIWFVIGEIDFKKYRLKMKEYVYIFLILILFLICGQMKNTILGAFIYILGSIIMMMVFLRDTAIYCYKQLKEYIILFFNKLKEKKIK